MRWLDPSSRRAALAVDQAPQYRCQGW